VLGVFGGLFLNVVQNIESLFNNYLSIFIPSFNFKK
jgi:hypothetical protein